MISKGYGRKAMALVAVAGLGLAACATSTDTGDESAETQDITFTYAYEQEFDAYNTGTAGTNATKNQIVMNRVIPGFWRYAPDGTLDPEEEFGTYEKTSDDPLTIVYTFDENAVWSDGEPIDCDDAYLAYIANSDKYKQFDTAGTTGYDLIDSVDCADGDKTFTVTYTEPFADWEGLFGTFMPAHVVEQQSEVPDFLAAAQAEDAKAMAAAGEFWSSGWVFKPGELPDASLIPSSGPYKLSAWAAGQSITLVANDAWWGTPAKAKTVVIRIVEPTAQPQALQNAEIQAMDPQPNPELLTQLEDLGDAVTVTTGEQFTFEHLDYNFNSEAFKDLKVRQAFEKCVPRQLIVDNLIKNQNPEAVVQQSRYRFPFQETYTEVAENVGAPDPAADVAGAKTLLEDANAVGTKVKIGYIAGNPRRADQFALIKDSCEQAGFSIIDGASPTFFDGDGELVSGNFDVAMFAWAGSALVTGSSSTYITDGGNNFGKYSNAEVDKLIGELNVTPDPAAQQELIIKIETILWEDLATIPLFTFPGLAAFASNTEGVVYNASQGGLTWNAEEWSIN